MEYKSDKDVIFSFMKRVDYNKTWAEIEHDLGYVFGDYNFGKGHDSQLIQKISDTIKFMKIQFDGIFNENHNTK
jgi:hypothetical protein